MATITGGEDERPGGEPPKAAPLPPATDEPASTSRGESEGSEAAQGEVLVLPLDALIPDDHGNIVLIDGVAGGELAIATREEVENSGVAAPEATAGGVDVAGFRFLRFRSGVTLYFPQETEVRVVPPE